MKKNLLRILKKIIDYKLPDVTPREIKIIDGVMRDFKIMEQNLSIDTGLSWDKFLSELKRNMKENELRKFLRWDIIKYTMFISYADYILIELRSIKKNNTYSSRYLNAIIESKIGYPEKYIYYRKSSANLIHHVYHILQYEKFLGSKVNLMDLVFEFGGGYGSMARVFKRLEFTNKYIIFDFPIFNIIQTYYLETYGFATTNDFFSDGSIVLLNEINELEILTKNTHQKNKLFIATWSFSESPISIREKIYPIIESFNYFLFAYQEIYDNVNNVKYFEEFQSKFIDVEWSTQKINHLQNSFYLFGKKR